MLVLHKSANEILPKDRALKYGALLACATSKPDEPILVYTESIPSIINPLKSRFENLIILKITKSAFYELLSNLDFVALLPKLEIKDLFVKLIKFAISKKASDIHLENIANGGLIRLRIDGELHNLCVLESTKFNALLSKIKLESKLDITQVRTSQDGRLGDEWLDSKNEHDFRISSVPLKHQAYSLTIRILYKHLENITIDSLGISKLDLLKTYAKKNNGLILITGTTGSGKSTTLCALLNYINENIQGKKIITLEDPIEYEMPFATQVQVDDDFPFDHALRAILRQDPDIIMVGEIRDTETLNLAIRAALTGHLVIATMHTNDAQSSLSRILNMGANLVELLSCLKLVLSQSLVPRRHLECDALGCEGCNFRGYLGREIISEALELSTSVKNAIVNGKLDEFLESGTFDSKLSDAREKIARGLIDEKILASF